VLRRIAAAHNQVPSATGDNGQVDSPGRDAAEDAGGAVRTGPPPTLLTEAIGGRRGVLDSGLPTLVFVVVDVLTSLEPAIGAALGAAALLCVLRLARREPVQQAIGGVVAVGVSALVAHQLGTAEGFFLPGILRNAALGVVVLVSLLVRRPLVGYVLAALDRHWAGWRDRRRLRRAADISTLVWAAVFVVRAAVEGWLYLHAGVAWLGAAKIGLGYPLWAAAVAVTFVLSRAARADDQEQREETGNGSAQADSRTRSSRWTTSRSYDDPSSAERSRVERPSSPGSSSAS
jgi:hypothetical protein